MASSMCNSCLKENKIDEVIRLELLLRLINDTERSDWGQFRQPLLSKVLQIISGTKYI